MKSTRYATYSSTDWQNINLPFPKLSDNEDAVELEIRAAGGEALSIWVDDISIK